MIQRLNFSEQIATVTKNLYARPTELLAEEIQDVPQGMVCLILPNQGYALAKDSYYHCPHARI